MEIYFKFAVLTFLIINIAFLINFFNKPTKEVEPKLLGSSGKVEDKFSSKIINTLKDSLLKYFKPQENSNIQELIKIQPDLMTHENILKFSKDSKISMFLESFKREDIYVVKVNYEKEIKEGREIPFGIITLYSINAESLISKKLNIGESTIRKCWSSKISGRIIGVVSSDNKQSLAVYYRKPKGNKSDYRIRFIHKLHCEAIDIERADLENKVYESNFYDDNSYDDFIIKGNSQVSYIAIQKDTLAFARDKDDYQYQIYQRVKSNKEVKGKKNKLSWRKAFLGPKINKKEVQYFHTNSLKFIPDSTHDFRMLQVYISISVEKGVLLNGEMTAANSRLSGKKIDGSFSNPATTKFFEHMLDEDVIGEKFSFEESVKKLKKYMKPTVFSNISQESLFFEIYNSNVLISMDWNDQTVQFQYLFDLHSKISRIFSEQSGENAIVKFEDDNDLVLIKREKNQDYKPGDNLYINAKSYSISLNNLPDKLRKEFVSFSLENLDNKVVLFAINEEGFFFALELTEDSKGSNSDMGVVSSLKGVILPDDSSSFLEVMIRYLITNIIPLILYLKYYSCKNEVDEVVENNKNKVNSKTNMNKLIRKINRLENKINEESIKSMLEEKKRIR